MLIARAFCTVLTCALDVLMHPLFIICHDIAALSFEMSIDLTASANDAFLS